LFEKIEPDNDTDSQNSVAIAAGFLAKKHNVWLHLGSVAVMCNSEKAINRAMLFSPAGKRIASYDKIHMFDVDLPDGETWRESSAYQAGNEAVMVTTSKFSIGLSICYDLRFPQLYRALAQSSCSILTCPAAFTKQTGTDHWHTLLRSRAIENAAFMVAAAQGGCHEDGRETFGHSLIVNPRGKIIAELDHDQTGILICDLDLEEVNLARTQIQSLNHDVDFELTNIDEANLQ
jgi:predicted amidohydrolase